ncbi:hypothetical protein HU200_002204 [Digitaria exilis]|uniref:Uncharacterized protein n=1 Tax=Digitaria exilis TaxID=1010633 RepID=A0A835KVF6_9POAL|nr:hypothetical protein HU200_002204 [Digitaria exilis]
MRSTETDSDRRDQLAVGCLRWRLMIHPLHAHCLPTSIPSSPRVLTRRPCQPLDVARTGTRQKHARKQPTRPLSRHLVTSDLPPAAPQRSDRTAPAPGQKHARHLHPLPHLVVPKPQLSARPH